ncbi:F-box domain-containing protein [Mycena sanguinolenta]|uniref:F-box domain-containing protein n=1 Tax=Mycena sanguinolenta TaxID=230812 RepID=A0A8H6Y7Y0_9AGAR|nr:F-box domain-containing protein [Mycena sanguinolenta]
MASLSDEVSLAENPLQCYISSIPPEILSKIMLMCDRDLTIWDEMRYWQPAGHNIPVRLTQICSSWRMVALDTRELWSTVTLMLNPKLVRNTSAITKFADYWLAKGQRSKLALKIDICPIFDDRIDLEPIGQLLTSWASDWRILTLANCPDSMAEYVIATMAQSPHLSLEEFELHAFSTVWHNRFEALAALPRLRTVTFRTWRTPSTHHILTLLLLPWSQLESVSISAPVSGHECLDVLQNCPELTTLELYVVSDVPDPESRRPVTLSKLSRLRLVAEILWDHNTSDIESFLGVLHLPILIDLDLYFIGRDPWNPLVSFFWQRHAARLRTLELSNLYFRADLRLLFLTMPNLVSLKLSPREIRLTAPDFDVLRVEHLLPALTHLDVAVGYERGVHAIDSVRSVITLLEARSTTTTGVAQLAQVRLADWTDWDEVDRDLSKADPEAMVVELQRLHVLEAAGMDVHWMVGGRDVLVSRATSIRSPSIRSASPRPSSSSEHHFDSDPTAPIPSLTNPKRNPLWRFWQRIKTIRLRSV